MSSSPVLVLQIRRKADSVTTEAVVGLFLSRFLFFYLCCFVLFRM